MSRQTTLSPSVLSHIIYLRTRVSILFLYSEGGNPTESLESVANGLKVKRCIKSINVTHVLMI
jgi:hypothetical protein